MIPTATVIETSKPQVLGQLLVVRFAIAMAACCAFLSVSACGSDDDLCTHGQALRNLLMRKKVDAPVTLADRWANEDVQKGLEALVGAEQRDPAMAAHDDADDGPGGGCYMSPAEIEATEATLQRNREILEMARTIEDEREARGDASSADVATRLHEDLELAKERLGSK